MKSPQKDKGHKAGPRLIAGLPMLLALSLPLILWGCGGGAKTDASGQPASGQPGAAPGPPPAGLVVQGVGMDQGVAPLARPSRAGFYAVWAGSYLDLEPAQKAVAMFQRLGYTAFTARKTLRDSRTFGSSPAGDFNLVLVGLFGERADSDALGRRLQAQGLVTQWQTVPSDNPGELVGYEAQTAPQEKESEAVASFAQKKAGAPLPPQSPAVTGAGFKKTVHGRFVGSYRDFQEAKAAARRLTAGGWPASVEETREGGGMWYRVYLAESKDPVDLKAQPEELERAKASAMRQPGMALLIDSSGLKGVWGTVKPNDKRTDASACQGYSQAGRALTEIERLVSYIPDNGMLFLVKPLSYNRPSGVVEKVTRPVKNWWTGDDSSLAATKPVFGPAVYNRPEVLKGVRRIQIDPRPAPLAPELQTMGDLQAIPGKKTVVLFSDFRSADKDSAAQAALGSLKGQYGGDLDLIVVYGDSDDQGWRLAESLAQAGGGGEAWNGCQLLADNRYFERFVKRVFKR